MNRRSSASKSLIAASLAKAMAFVALTILVIAMPSAAGQSVRRAYGARVLAVHDGDTVTLRFDFMDVRTRLLGIDAPEMGQRPWGKRSKEHLIDLMNSVEWYVYVETDVVRQDKYGRMLAYLWTGKGELINEKMLQDGQACVFVIKPNGRYESRFRKAEGEAKKGRKGIWQDHGLRQSPFEYREMHPRQESRMYAGYSDAAARRAF